LTLLPRIINPSGADDALKARIDLVDALSARPDVPVALEESWVGGSVYTFALQGSFIVSRAQDPSDLFKAGKDGLPLLVLSGSEDKILKSEETINLLKPQFRRFESQIIQGAGHIVFYDAQETVVRRVTAFVERVVSPHM
jgi:pimeloyl-ACP methyl ester carboxylesterase